LSDDCQQNPKKKCGILAPKKTQLKRMQYIQVASIKADAWRMYIYRFFTTHLLFVSTGGRETWQELGQRKQPSHTRWLIKISLWDE
jgi:hypothetical protein